MLVTGAAGMLGRDLVDQLAGRHEVTAVDLEVDVTDPDAVRACVEGCRPEAVFHLAAFTDVDGAEEREDEAGRINAGGAANAARAAAAVGAALVLPSNGLRVRRAQGRALRRGRRPGAARGLRAHQAGGRAGRAGAVPGHARGAHGLALRRGRAELRGHHAAPRARSGTRWPWWTTRRARRPGRASSARALEALLEQPAGRVPRGRRRVGHLGGSRRRRLRGGRARLPGAPDHHRRAGAPGPAARRCRRSRSPAPARRACGPGARPWPTTWMGRTRREAAGDRRLRLHRVGLRAPGPGARSRGGQPRQAHLRRQPGEPRRRGRRRGLPLRARRHRRRGGRDRGRSRASTRWSTSPPRATWTAASSTRRSSSAPTWWAPPSCWTPPGARGVRRFVQVSTDEVYGSHPAPEPSGRPTRSAPRAPTRRARPGATCRCSPGTAPSASTRSSRAAPTPTGRASTPRS